MNTKYALLLAVCFLSGCSRYYKWGKSFFTQADKRNLHESCIKPYHTYVTVHDGFETVGWFDVLWMADPVWDWYNANVVKRYGLPAGGLQKLEDEQDAENSAYITFYLLMSQPNVSTDPLPRLGTHVASQWSIVLAVDGDEYQATNKFIFRLNQFHCMDCTYSNRTCYQNTNNRQVKCCICISRTIEHLSSLHKSATLIQLT